MADVAPRVFLSAASADRGLVREALPVVAAAMHVEWVRLRVEPLAQWRARCSALLGGSDAVLCVAGPGSRANRSVAWELAEARRLDLPVVVLATRGAPAPEDVVIAHTPASAARALTAALAAAP